jgi:hypothetical protein
MLGPFKKKDPPQEPPKRIPPVPSWRPTIKQPLDEIAERISVYTNQQRDLAIFENGTCVLLPDDLSDDQAKAHAKEVLYKIFHFHPDMNPLAMKDGNILVRYNHPAVNLVIDRVAVEHRETIDKHHLAALATSEVLMTPLGPNKFDEFGKKALFGRCFMFMDAQAPNVVRVIRRNS